jgi:hypothetical protein
VRSIGEALNNNQRAIAREPRGLRTDDQIVEIRRAIADGEPPYEHERRYDLSTKAEVLGYCIEVARQRGWGEVEVIDALLKVATLFREDVREVEKVLRPLGYAAVADHLHKIARHLSKRPPRRWTHLTRPSQDIAGQSWGRPNDPLLH